MKGAQGHIFQDRPVEPFNPAFGLTLPERLAYELRLSDADLHQCSVSPWLDPASLLERRLASLLDDPLLPRLEALIVGEWAFHKPQGGSTLAEIDLAGLISRAKGRLGALQNLYVGPFPPEPAASPWAWLHDFPLLLGALPRLHTLSLRVRGLSPLSALRHAGLQSLTLETAMPAERLLEWLLHEATFPALRSLTLWCNDPPFAPTHAARLQFQTLIELLLSTGKIFPKLRHLGLRNLLAADDLATHLAGAPLLGKLRGLDLSMGTLTEKGARALLQHPTLGDLDVLDLSHSFLSGPVLHELEQLSIPALRLQDQRLPSRREPPRPLLLLRHA